MPRPLTALLAAALVVATVGVVPGAAADGLAAQASPAAEAAEPGARLAGVVGVGQAEVRGEVQARAVGLAVARAGTADAKAGVVAGVLDRTADRLDALEARKAALQAARDNGSVSEAAYRGRIASLSAEVRATERVLNHTEVAAGGLPADVLAAHGVNATAIETLQGRAGELGGGEVAEIARSIAGPGAGSPVDVERPEPAANRTRANASSAPGNGGR